MVLESHGQVFPVDSVSKESACNVGDPDSILGLGRSPGEGHGNPLQDSFLGNSKDRGGRWTSVLGLTSARARTHTHTHTHTHTQDVLLHYYV